MPFHQVFAVDYSDGVELALAIDGNGRQHYVRAILDNENATLRSFVLKRLQTTLGLDWTRLHFKKTSETQLVRWWDGNIQDASYVDLVEQLENAEFDEMRIGVANPFTLEGFVTQAATPAFMEAFNAGGVTLETYFENLFSKINTKLTLRNNGVRH